MMVSAANLKRYLNFCLAQLHNKLYDVQFSDIEKTSKSLANKKTDQIHCVSLDFLSFTLEYIN